MNVLKLAVGVSGLAALSACGGASTFASANALGYQTQFAFLQLAESTNGALFTPVADLPSGSATYSGIANVGFVASPSSLNTYFGELEVNVNFVGNNLSGSIENFADYSIGNVTPVSGSVAITSGSLTGNNTFVGNGLTASANGSIDGQAVNWNVTGHFSGDNGEVVGLYFNGPGAEGGVGLAER